MLTRLPIHLKLSAIPMLVLLAGYPFFPAYFNWAQEMSAASLLTQQIFWVRH